MCPEHSGHKVQEQKKGKAIFLLIMTAVYFVGYLLHLLFQSGNLSLFCFAVGRWSGFARPGSGSGSALPFGQSCLRLPVSKLGIPLPTLLCSSLQENALMLLLNCCKALGGGSEMLFPGGIGDGGPWHCRETGHLAAGQKPLVRAKSPWKTPRY